MEIDTAQATATPTRHETAPDAGAEPHGHLDGWSTWARQGLRAGLCLRLGALPSRVPPVWLLAAFALSCAVDLAVGRLAFSGEAVFSLWGWLYNWASVGIWLLVLGWWFALGEPHKRHATPVTAWLTLSWVALLPMQVISGAITQWALSTQYPAALNSEAGRWGLFGLFVVWVGAINWRLAQALIGQRGLRVALVVSGMAIGVLSSLWLRSSPWEVQRSSEANRVVLELSQAVFERQQRLLQTQTDTLLPSDGSSPQVFALIYAPYEQDVFLRESKMVSDVLATRFGAEGRTLTLLNHTETTGSRPWATPANLERAVNAMAGKMDLERDVLVMYLTSHGGQDHRLASRHWPLTVPDLTATAVRNMLDKAGIRYRVVGVSACYSGGWVGPLKGENTLVMTAADEDHTSYGCGALSELTFFGRALFDEELRQSHSFEQAFANAVPRIKQREEEAGKDDGFSNPQIAVGTGFRQHWNHTVQAALEQAPTTTAGCATAASPQDSQTAPSPRPC
jgi:hypothetical protein